MTLAGVEFEMLVSEPDSLTTRTPQSVFSSLETFLSISICVPLNMACF